MKPKFLLSYITISLIMLNSCKEETTVNNNSYNPKSTASIQNITTAQMDSSIAASGIIFPGLRDKRLEFNSEEEFETYYTCLRTIGDTRVIQYWNKQNNFVSYADLETFTKGQKDSLANVYSNIDRDFVEISDYYFQSCLNFNKELVYNDNYLYKIKTNYIFICDYSNPQYIDDFMANPVEIPDGEEYVYNSYLNVYAHYTENKALGFGRRNFGTPVAYGANFRFWINPWQENWVIFQTIGVRAIFQEKTGWWIFSTWNNRATNYTTLSGYAYFTGLGGLYAPWGANYCQIQNNFAPPTTYGQSWQGIVFGGFFGWSMSDRVAEYCQNINSNSNQATSNFNFGSLYGSRTQNW